MTNLILNTDSYKLSHFKQYPAGTEFVSSYIESRGVSKNFPEVTETVFFGLQMFIREYLLNPITHADIEEAASVAKLHGVPFHKEGWEYILEQHFGFLPLSIRAVPEGGKYPIGTPLVEVRNIDPNCFWLTSYIETALLRAIWYPTTVATLSRYLKETFKGFLDLTSDTPDHLEFMLHDFGARGVSSKESAGIGGLAHLVNFQGTDTLEAILYARKYYEEMMAGYSIPAAEHSTITSWSREGERMAYENMVDQFGNGLYAVVSDSYDIYNAVDNIWGKDLKDKVIEFGGRLVIRPDSGDPVEVTLTLIESLGKSFGFTKNSKGYKVLHPSVRLIQGDGVNPNSIVKILQNFAYNGWSAENIVFGMGGALLQKVDRDSLKFAMKASAIRISGIWNDVYKDPVTDPGKVSKKGIQKHPDMRFVYEAGTIFQIDPLWTIRNRANA